MIWGWGWWSHLWQSPMAAMGGAAAAADDIQWDNGTLLAWDDGTTIAWDN